MGISFVLKPRREDRTYNIFLYAQWFVFAYLGSFFGLVGEEFETGAIIRVSLEYSLLYLALFIFGMKLRSHIAKLTDKDLSHFLTGDVVMGGVIIGIGQLAVLIFKSIQCNNISNDLIQCRRTHFNQTGGTKPWAPRAQNKLFADSNTARFARRRVEFNGYGIRPRQTHERRCA